MRIILASQSPRRKQLLERMGVKFEVIPAQGEEIVDDRLSYGDIVINIAKEKAKEVLEKTNVAEDTMIIASDTIVVYDDEICGKPKDEQDAKRMLKMFSDSYHEVFTGLYVLIIKDNVQTDYAEFDKVGVFSREVSDEMIDKYIKSGEPMGKAGAYTIQGIGANFIEKIYGPQASVTGLPVGRLYDIFVKEKINFFNFDKKIELY